jgi:RNA polymerase sigma factor (sigma-70 family)
LVSPRFACNEIGSRNELNWNDVRPDEPLLKALMVSALDGDKSAYRQLLHSLAPILGQYLGRRVASGHEDIEDIVQETLLAIDTRRITFDRTRPFTPWVFAIAHHKFVDLVRRGRVTTILTDDLIGDQNLDDAIMAKVDIETLLETLPRKQANAIRAVKLDGLSVSEAAKRYKMGESDVKISVHRGLKFLMQKIGKQ